MSGGQYKQKTKVLGIPCPGYKDRIWPEMELLRMQIIENMLLGGMRGEVNSVFDEGAMSVRRGEEGKYRVILSATGSSTSVKGTVGGAYFQAPSTVAWEGLEDGHTYLLYIKGTPKTFQNASDVRPVASERRIRDSASVLLAKVDLRGDKPVLDRNPDGKVNSRDLVRHVTDYENPHGDRQVQDELMVRKGLVFDEGAVLEVGADHDAVRVPMRQVVAAMQTSRQVMGFKTGGPEGVILTAGGSVSFVQVSRCCKGTLGTQTLGDVAVGYFGEDKSVTRPDQFVVRNTGDVGIEMRALVIVG